MCDLWRMSLCPGSPVRSRLWSRNSGTQYSALQWRPKQRDEVAANKFQPDQPQYQRQNKVSMDGGAGIFKRSRDGMSLSSISVFYQFSLILVHFSVVSIFPQFTFFDNGARAVKKQAFTVTPSHFAFCIPNCISKKVTLSTLAVFFNIAQKNIKILLWKWVCVLFVCSFTTCIPFFFEKL